MTKYGLGFNTKRTFVDQQKWRLLDLVEHHFENTNEFKDSPRIQFKCFANRRPFYYYANAFSMIFLITITAIGIKLYLLSSYLYFMLVFSKGTFAISCSLPQNRLHTTGKRSYNAFFIIKFFNFIILIKQLFF